LQALQEALKVPVPIHFAFVARMQHFELIWGFLRGRRMCTVP
jgi:hypothetical protein